MTTPAPPRLVASEVRREAATETAAASEAAIGMRALAHRLLSEHRELFYGPNAVMSSASIGTAFAMLRAGAEGETAAQIDAVLGFPSAGLGPAYNFLTDQWTTTGDDGPELAIANSLFVQDGYGLEPEFLDALAREFGAGVRTVDFSTDQAVRIINEWVRRQTRDRIDRLFDSFDPDTRLVLANAAVRLPYRGGELSMWVLLPTGGANPVELLAPSVLAEAADKAEPMRVALALPKWDIKWDLPLNAALQAMGMPRAFTDLAEFPGVSAEALKIDQAMHRADITVDEAGTEAAVRHRNLDGAGGGRHAAGRLRRRSPVRVRRTTRRDRFAPVRGRRWRSVGGFVGCHPKIDIVGS